MIFHKGTFNIQVITVVENLKPTEFGLREVEGWIDNTNTYGFHKKVTPKGKVLGWAATDLASGSRIVTRKTRKECADWIENNIGTISIQKDTSDYTTIVERFRELQIHRLWKE
jgi:hypothetical protein